MEVVVFTNGCFDLIHPGHIDLLEKAKSLGTKLIVGINSDKSVRTIKGFPRPFISQNDRAVILRGLRAVDEVRIFDESTPENLIREINPDVLVKGGDWTKEQIIGSDIVLAKGGRVYSIPLKNGYSSSSIAKNISNADKGLNPYINSSKENSISESIRNHIDVFEKINENLIAEINNCGELIIKILKNNKKILICGNGGSAADAQHFSTELVGRFEKERKGLPAIALTTDTSGLTAIGNDYGFERIFARQVEALASEGDLLIGISTSGNSPNILSAVMAARSIGCKTIGLTGTNGKKLGSLCDASLLVPSGRTAHIQEAHIAVIHIWCEMIDRAY